MDENFSHTTLLDIISYIFDTRTQEGYFPYYRLSGNFGGINCVTYAFLILDKLGIDLKDSKLIKQCLDYYSSNHRFHWPVHPNRIVRAVFALYGINLQEVLEAELGERELEAKDEDRMKKDGFRLGNIETIQKALKLLH